MKKQMWYTQEIQFETNLFGKNYYWMKDVDDSVYLAKAMPVFAASVQGKIDNGELSVKDAQPFIEGWAPDFA